MRETAEQHGWSWQAELVSDPDPILADSDQIVASADSLILDRADRWFNLAAHAIDDQVPGAWIVRLARDLRQ